MELASIRLGLSCSLLVARAFPCKALEILSLHDLKVDRSTKCGQDTRGSGSVVVFNGRMGFRAKRFASCRSTSQAVQRNVFWRSLPPGLAVKRVPHRQSADTNPRPVYNWILSCLGHPRNFPLDVGAKNQTSGLVVLAPSLQLASPSAHSRPIGVDRSNSAAKRTIAAVHNSARQIDFAFVRSSLSIAHFPRRF